MSNKTDTAKALANLKEKKEKVLRDHLKQELASHPRFIAMADSYRKSKKYFVEVTKLTEDDKYDAQVATLKAKLDTLEQKRATALEALPNLTTLIADHESAQSKLATALLSSMEDGELPGNLDEQVDTLLDEIGTEALEQEPNDPLVSYRKAKKED